MSARSEARLWRKTEARFCSGGAPLFGAYVIAFAVDKDGGCKFTLSMSGYVGTVADVDGLRPQIAEFFKTGPDLVRVTRNPHNNSYCEVRVAKPQRPAGRLGRRWGK